MQVKRLKYFYLKFTNLSTISITTALILIFLSISACTEKVPDKDNDQNFSVDRTYSIKVLNKFNISEKNLMELTNLTRSKLREVYDYLPPMGEFSKFSIQDTLSVYKEEGIAILRYTSTGHYTRIRWRNTDQSRMNKFYEKMVDYFTDRLGEASVVLLPGVRILNTIIFGHIILNYLIIAIVVNTSYLF